MKNVVVNDIFRNKFIPVTKVFSKLLLHVKMSVHIALILSANI